MLVRIKRRFHRDEMLHFEEATRSEGYLTATIIFQYAAWNLRGCCSQELVLVPASAEILQAGNK